MGRQPSTWTIRTGIFVCLAGLAISPARGQTFNWNPILTGSQSWSVDGNWDQSGFPNGAMHVANLSVPLTSATSTDLANGDVTLAGLKIGSTASAVETDVISNSNSEIVFQNDDSSFNAGIPLITSVGVSGSTNVISANVRLNEQLDFSSASTNNVTINGWTYADGAAPSIRSLMPAGVVAKINRLDITNFADPSNYRRFRLNDSAGSPPGMPTINTQGNLEIGDITGYGELSIGVTASQHPVPLGTVVLRGGNTMVGYIQLNRANLVLANDSALGLYGIFGGQPNQGVGMNLLSDNDARVDYGSVELSQWFTIKGEHSLSMNGLVGQSNSRGWINLLPAGKTFTLGGEQYAVTDEDTARTYTFDGTGRTVVTGGLYDKFIYGQGPATNGTGSYRKTGTGSVLVAGTTSTYHGTTIVEAGVLRFASNGHLANTSAIVSTGGAIGVDSGIYSNPALLAKFDAADTGGVMLSVVEANTNLDFTSAPLQNAANTSIAAPEEGITYTGTITPATSNYRLGGGTGTLTMPLQNQLTGARGLIVTNGGEVRLTATNNYTGPTVISDTPFTSRTNQAIADTTNGISQQLFAPTTLTVSKLGGSGFSSIGNSSNDAASLVIQGSTLRIDGLGDKTSRLFTVGSRGATIETVGLTRAFFENTSPLAIEPSGPTTSRTLTLAATSILNSMDPLIPNAPDGGVVGVTKRGPGSWSLFGNNSYSGLTHIQEGTLNINGTQTGLGETIVDAAGTLGGNGSVGDNVTIHGAISPGQSVGTLQIAGNLLLDDFSTTIIEIGNATPAGIDRLVVSGTAQLAGTLHVRMTAGSGGPYVPKLGDVFPFLFVAGGASGMFSSFNLPTLSDGLEWQINPSSRTVNLAVVAVPEPACLTILATLLLGLAPFGRQRTLRR